MPGKRHHDAEEEDVMAVVEEEKSKRCRMTESVVPQLSVEQELLHRDGCSPQRLAQRFRVLQQFCGNWTFVSQVVALCGVPNFLKLLDWQSLETNAQHVTHCASTLLKMSSKVTSHTFVRNVPSIVLSNFCLRYGDILEGQVTAIVAKYLFRDEELLSISVHVGKIRDPFSLDCEAQDNWLFSVHGHTTDRVFIIRSFS